MDSTHESRQSVVAIASSADEALGERRAPLDAQVEYAQIDAVVRRALDLDSSPGALQKIVRPDDWVLVKPNIVTSRSHRDCSYWYGGVDHPGQVTDLRVIKSLVGYLLERCRPRRLSIAEGGAEWRRTGAPGTPPEQQEDGWTVSWPEFEGLSYAQIVEEFAARHPGVVDIVDLNYDPIRFVPVPDPRNSGLGALQRQGQERRPDARFGREAYVPGTGTPRPGYYIPESVLTCDKLISVPAMKTHVCGTTLAIKNYVGILPNHPSGTVSKAEVHRGDLQKGFVDLFSYHPADYSLIEGFWSTEGNGPQWGDNLHHNVVVASADPVAADAVASAVMGFNPADLDYLHYAAQKGFGTLDLERVEVAGTPVDQVRRVFKRAAGRKGVGFAARGSRAWLVRQHEQEEWQVFASEERYIDLDRHFDGLRPEAAWAAVQVRSRAARTGHLWASADGRMRVRLNGEEVLRKETAAGHRFAECRVEVELRQGTNWLEVHLERSPAGLGFTALLCDELGNGLSGVEYQHLA